MGRPQTGPRPDRAGGILKAHLKIQRADGTTQILRESLKTRDKGVALRRWPSAMERLKRKAAGVGEIPLAPIRPDDLIAEYPLDSKGHPIDAPQLITAASIYDPETFEITWEQALEIHCRRKHDRTGRSIAASTKRSARTAWQPLNRQPALITIQDVRDYVIELQSKGYAATSIEQRCGLLGGITNTLIKGGWLADDAINPWLRVETSAARKVHHRPATPAELRRMFGGSGEETQHSCLKGEALLALKLSTYLGLRIGEITSRGPEHLVGGELIICATPTWRPKSEHSERTLPVPDWCKAIPEGGFPQRTTLNKWIKRSSGAEDLSSHGLRGAWRTASREAEISTELAEHLFGHAQATSLINTYGEFNAQAKLTAMQKVWKVMDGWITSRV